MALLLCVADERLELLSTPHVDRVLAHDTVGTFIARQRLEFLADKLDADRVRAHDTVETLMADQHLELIVGQLLFMNISQPASTINACTVASSVCLASRAFFPP